MELARHGILVNAIAPGYVETDFNRDFLRSEAGKKLEGAHPAAPGRAARRSRRRDAAAGIAGRRLHHRRGDRGRWRPRRRRDLTRRRMTTDAARALARFLASAAGAGAAEITSLAPLRGGAIQENWAVDARFSGGRLAGEQRLVLRTAAPTGVAVEPRPARRICRAAGRLRGGGHGARAALCVRAIPAVFGKPFFVMRRVDGTAAAHRITRDDTRCRALRPSPNGSGAS